MAAIDLFQRWKRSEKNSTDITNEQNHVITSPVYENESLAIQLLYDKVHELTNKINAHINSIAANTAKTSMTLGTTGSTALAGDTNIVTIGSSTTIAFGDMITVPAKGKVPASYSIVMTVTNGGVSKAVTLTLT